MRWGLIAAVTVSTMAGVSVARAADAAHGKQLFIKVGCYECHGTEGQGAITGPKLAPDPLRYDGFAAFVRSTSQQMPPYPEKILADQDLADIHAYLQSIAKPPDYKTIPILNQR
jgi:mono/diheme cytochrome c family protein